jgi:filamentous hemagglutinin
LRNVILEIVIYVLICWAVDTSKTVEAGKKLEEIQGLSPLQIKNKFALPELPTHASDVYVPAGTHIRVGTVGSQEGWGMGGGIHELLERIPESAFKNTRLLAP